MTEIAPPRPRFAIIDIARGLAIIAMIAYHLCWDLSYFRFIAADVGYDPHWVIIARTILASFLFMVGVGLVLGHGRGIRWAAFWKRWAFVAGAALLTTLGTLTTGIQIAVLPSGNAWPNILLGYELPLGFIYFGVLHAIAVCSVLALPFLRAPIWLPVLAAVALIGLPFVYSDALFNEKIWSWIGFWQVPPPANDLVPIFPWFGVVLLGVIITRLILASSLAERLARIRPVERLPRVLAFMGRWSLLIYLLHQPLLLGLVYPAAAILKPEIAMRTSDFLGSCQSTCTDGGTSAAMCTTYCQCGLAGVEENDLWNAIFTGRVSAQEQVVLDASNLQCSTLIYPELNAPQ